jgi:hypothetical protein
MVIKADLIRQILRGLKEGLSGDEIPHEGYSEKEFSEYARILHQEQYIVALYVKSLQADGYWLPFRLKKAGRRLLESAEDLASAQPTRHFECSQLANLEQ